jgi:hypothetical protein
VLKSDILEQGNDRSEQYVAALAFKGAYNVTVKQAFGKPIGGTATLKVTKFKGTPREAHDLITVEVGSSRPIEVKLEAGSRTELATISKDVETVLQTDEFRSEAARGGLSNETSGFGGGFGPMSGGVTATSGRPNVPMVNEMTEKSLPGIGSNAADLRASVKVNADRQTMSFHVNPVFGTGKPVTMPKVPLIPGSETK